jgi:hypothetical protein
MGLWYYLRLELVMSLTSEAIHEKINSRGSDPHTRRLMMGEDCDN